MHQITGIKSTSNHRQGVHQITDRKCIKSQRVHQNTGKNYIKAQAKSTLNHRQRVSQAEYIKSQAKSASNHRQRVHKITGRVQQVTGRVCIKSQAKGVSNHRQKLHEITGKKSAPLTSTRAELCLKKTASK